MNTNCQSSPSQNIFRAIARCDDCERDHKHHQRATDQVIENVEATAQPHPDFWYPVSRRLHHRRAADLIEQFLSASVFLSVSTADGLLTSVRGVMHEAYRRRSPDARVGSRSACYARFVVRRAVQRKRVERIFERMWPATLEAFTDEVIPHASTVSHLRARVGRTTY
jgi:hypothetical protein